jgi:hypothetical protein
MSGPSEVVTKRKSVGPVVEINGKELVGWEYFHDTFARVLGFPDYYGRNMNAWIDCMIYLDDPPPNQTNISLADGEVLTLAIQNWRYLKAESKNDEWDALVECSAFVNSARIQMGRRAILALALGYEHPLEVAAP